MCTHWASIYLVVSVSIWGNYINRTAWMKDTVLLENALELIPMRLHPGAERYYREIGMVIPEPATY